LILGNAKKARMRQMLADIGRLVKEYADQIEEHRELFTALYDLVKRIEKAKQNEDTWNTGWNIPTVMYYTIKSNNGGN